jgi:DNA-binding NtrC family response regulator
MTVVYQSQAMSRLLEQAKRFARTSATVLIQGESGTGKELLARLIHDHSPRRDFPYVRINCAALAETLVDSEFFGHEAGAFTGASSRRVGRFENACEGTVFLDEIGELPLNMQAKLLRVLEEKEFQRVGGNDVLSLRARVIAATNRDLAQEAEAGRFRFDLYYRLNVLPLKIPSLRERREDIPALVNHFTQAAQHELDQPVQGVNRAVMEQLCDYNWPGNIRELRNVILRSCLLSAGKIIQTIDLPKSPGTVALVSATVPGPGSTSLVRPQSAVEVHPQRGFEHLTLQEIERQVILQRLKLFDGNKSEAAAALGVTPRTLRNKMLEYRKLGYVG